MTPGGTSPRLLLPSLAAYQRSWVGRDVVAGLVLSALLVPQGMAYAELAGLPAVTGLYTSILCLVGYALVGPSRLLVLGPDSALGPMIAATVLPLVGAGGDPVRAVLLASALAIATGLLMLGAGFGRLGYVADLLSKPTILGYMTGLAVTILVGQLPKLLGFSVDSDSFLGDVAATAHGIANGEVLLPAAAIGLLSLVVILVLDRLLPKLPNVLVAVIIAMTVSVVAGLEARGVKVIGTLPEGLPTFHVPVLALHDLSVITVGAIGIALVALADTISTATSFAERTGEEVDGNREMIGIGVANVGAGLFQGFPVSTSGSRTAVAQSAGAKTQVTGLVGAAVIALMLVAFPSLLAPLPQPTLAAIVIAAALSLADLPATRRLRRQSRGDFLVFLAAFLGVTLLGVLPGIIVAIVVSVGTVFARIWRPYTTTLGRAEGVPGLHDRTRYPEAEVVPGCTVYRFDAPLIFANAGTFRREVLHLLVEQPKPRWIVVAAEPITDVDTSAADMLEDLVTELEAAGTQLHLAELKDPVRLKVGRLGLEAVLGPDRFHPTVNDAVRDYRRETGEDWGPPTAEAPREGDGAS
ncbi:MAG TPA: sulfate permease [Candidatus Nanopelagicales bacterium]|nr:sulfate permease [Candidatus Nanopelagicales bacterium]